MTRHNPRKKRPGKRPAGHHGRGTPQVSRAERRNAHALVAGTDSPDAGVRQSEGVRLNRWLAERGIDSRRKCDALIQEGSVEVNLFEPLAGLGRLLSPVIVEGEITRALDDPLLIGRGFAAAGDKANESNI